MIAVSGPNGSGGSSDIGGLGNIAYVVANRNSTAAFTTTISNSVTYFDILPTDFDTIQAGLNFSVPSDGVFQYDGSDDVKFTGVWYLTGANVSGGSKQYFLDTALNGSELGQRTRQNPGGMNLAFQVPFETDLSNGDQINLSVQNTVDTVNWRTNNIFLIGQAVSKL